MKFGSLYSGISSVRPRKWRRFLLAFLYCGGLLSGIFLAAQASDGIIAWMRSVQINRMSVVELLPAALFPFLISALAVLISQYWLLFPICFLKAFSFGYCAGGIWQIFGSAGWLGYGLLLFTDLCAMPMLYFFWLRHIDGVDTAPSELALYASLLFFIGSLDHCLISPFTAGILNF